MLSVVRQGEASSNNIPDDTRTPEQLKAHYEQLHLEEERIKREEEICNRIVNFDLRPFDSPDKKYSGEKMDEELIRKLVILEMKLERKLHYNCGYRTHNHNERLRAKGVKAAANSAHMSHKAVDIKALTSKERFEILAAATEVGFTRIGIHNRFVHLDIDESKPQESIWLY